VEYTHNVRKTILLADDDVNVRSFIKALLELSGYKVIEAHDGQDAVEKFIENREEIHLLLLDIMMPRKSGKDAYDDISKLQPGIKALFISGYPGDFITHTDFLAKPFKASVLLNHLNGMLN
jgi:CheY-like chemotaxis protein